MQMYHSEARGVLLNGEDRVTLEPSLVEEGASPKERNGASPPSFCTMGHRKLKRTYSRD